MRHEDRERVVHDLVSRLVGSVLAKGSQALEGALADTIYHERQRLEKERPSPERQQGLQRWDRARSELLRGSDEARRELLRGIVTEFAREIRGNFDPKVHAFATRAVPIGLSALLHAASPRQLLRRFPGLGLDDRVVVDGALEQARALQGAGTLVFVPSHSSNLDSIILGWAMHEAGFPPLLYGAGLNLFSNPLISYFMRNLGAYTVDRRKTAPLYRAALKEYATLSLEYGYDNLFFPGGTRARSGALESKLKLGLLGTSLRAYANNLAAGRPKPNIYIVPMTLSYELVLEAETLIDDYLRETGRSRYIITDDEFASPRRIVQFLNGILELDATIHMTLLPPLDPFGNDVDGDGVSRDGRGRPIAIERYLWDARGTPCEDPQRDEEFTRQLGERLVGLYHQGNTVMPTHVAAWVVFEELRRQNPGVDLFRFLRAGGPVDSIGFADAARLVARLVERLEGMAREGKIRLGERVRLLDADDLLLAALRSLGTYHSRPALKRLGDRVYAEDRNLLYYYRNRLTGYGLEREP